MLTCVKSRDYLIIQLVDLFTMGNSSNSNEPLQKGEGYRIIEVKENSPFHNKVQPFFDFIIEVTPPEGPRSPTEILDKLSGPSSKAGLKSPLLIMKENVDRSINVKIVSTKYRKVRTIEVTPNNQWSGTNDLIGISFRKERFDEAFETYYPLVDIKINSPIKKAGVREGQYLIGCLEYAYPSIDAFMEGLYEKYFDKETKDKSVHLAVYDIASDTLALREVVLARGWGGKGLLGCEFLQGMLNKFPTNLQEQRQQILQQEAKKAEVLKLRGEMGDCDGASKVLAESLHSQRSKRAQHYQRLRNLLNTEPPKLSLSQGTQAVGANQSAPSGESSKDLRIEELQKRVATLEASFAALKHCLSELKEPVEEDLQLQS